MTKITQWVTDSGSHITELCRAEMWILVYKVRKRPLYYKCLLNTLQHKFRRGLISYALQGFSISWHSQGLLGLLGSCQTLPQISSLSRTHLEKLSPPFLLLPLWIFTEIIRFRSVLRTNCFFTHWNSCQHINVTEFTQINISTSLRLLTNNNNN